MSITISDDQMLELLREQIAQAVERERPLIRQEIIDSFKWVTAETGVEMIEIEGKDKLRTFRRLMTTYGVETLKLAFVIRYRWKSRANPKSQVPNPKGTGLSIEELIEAHVVRPTAKKKLPRLELVNAA